MEIIPIAENIIQIKSSEILIEKPQDALDLITMAKYEHQANAIIINKEQITEEFFDLKTGLAGDILQKFTSYQTKIAIIGDFTTYQSKAFHDFIRESNEGQFFFFLSTIQEAIQKLS